MSKDEPFRTDYEFLKGVDYIFVSFDRNLSGEECHELAEKYFETHQRMTLPGQALRVDFRPAFRKPLADVAPKFRAVSIGYTFMPQQWASARMWAERNRQRNRLRDVYSRSHDAVIRVDDAAGNVIETHEHNGDFKEW